MLSELRKPSPSAPVVDWFERSSSAALFSSVLVIGELRYGAESLRHRDPRRSLKLDEWIAAVQEGFAERVLPVTTPVAEAWGRLRAVGPLPFVDGLLAATALVHGLTVVTRDTDPFERVGVPWLDPWSA